MTFVSTCFKKLKWNYCQQIYKKESSQVIDCNLFYLNYRQGSFWIIICTDEVYYHIYEKEYINYIINQILRRKFSCLNLKESNSIWQIGSTIEQQYDHNDIP